MDPELGELIDSQLQQTRPMFSFDSLIRERIDARITESPDANILAAEADKLFEELREQEHRLLEQDDWAQPCDSSKLPTGSIKRTPLENIKQLMRKLEPNLRNILRGKTDCRRHQAFKSGGIDRGCLNMQVAFGILTEDQEETVISTLMDMFCSRDFKYFDYVMKVLVPESFAMLYADINKVSQEEAERIICDRC